MKCSKCNDEIKLLSQILYPNNLCQKCYSSQGDSNIVKDVANKKKEIDDLYSEIYELEDDILEIEDDIRGKREEITDLEDELEEM